MVSAKIKRQLSVIILLALSSVVSVFLHIAIPSQQHHSDEEFHLLLAECIHALISDAANVLKTVFHRTDDEMYKEKRAFYQGRNDRRSR
ncbi:MAG: hypothetical protein IJT42_03455 [Treponema sp.]|nr:hypothetical protein [Treponema sp.]